MNDIFDEVMSYAGAEYISDLHSKALLNAIISCLEDIDENKYPVEQWNLLISYIAACECHFTEISQAKSFIKNLR